MSHTTRAAAVLIALTLAFAATGCSNAPQGAEAARKLPSNVGKGPETLAAAPTGEVADTPSWTELPKPVAAAFATAPVRGKFQAFSAMEQSTAQVELKAMPTDKEVFAALAALDAVTPKDYAIQLNVYAPGSDGKLKYRGWVWETGLGTLVRKSSNDADQGWDAAITAQSEGETRDMTPEKVAAIAAGSEQPPVF